MLPNLHSQIAQETGESQAEISEIFSSIQGEGPYLGVRQIFVRFGRCNMHCGYCDEFDKMKPEAFTKYSLSALAYEMDRLEGEQGRHHSVSLTGGEPLFYTPFLKKWMPELKRRGLKTYLETNGTLPGQLKQVIDWCDIIAMDMKPASSTGDRNFYAEHKQFLKIAIQKDVFIKIVVTPKTRPEEIRKCIDMVAGVNPRIIFIFQPLSDPIGINTQALALIEKDLFPMANSKLTDVRVVPQMHKIWGVR